MVSEVEVIGVSVSPGDISHSKKDLPESKPEFAKHVLEFSSLHQYESQNEVLGELLWCPEELSCVKLPRLTGRKGSGLRKVNGELKCHSRIILDTQVYTLFFFFF